MTIGFSTQIDNKPTLFVEKIWSGLITFCDIPAYQEIFENYKQEPRKIIGLAPKIHTIRKDTGGRWKAGNKIHMVTGNRTKSRFQFAPVVEVQSVQKISIYWGDVMPNEPSCYIDGECIAMGYAAKNWEKLALNDGFDSTDEFFNWFKDDFQGKIIHWTDLKYNTSIKNECKRIPKLHYVSHGDR